jgi:hypothetical protein
LPESSNFAKLAHRRKITPGAIGDILTGFEALDLVTDRTPPTARTLASMCRRSALSACDAAYFELAIRLELPLAAKGGPLFDAPRNAGIAFA